MPQVHPNRVKSWATLERGITPSMPGEPERIPWQWFDTQTYISGTTTTLDFFQSVQSDKVLGNMQAAGQIPAPMAFEIHHIGFYYQIGVTNTDITGTGSALGGLNDVVLLNQGRMVLEVAQKTYYETSLNQCPGGGGALGIIAMAATQTAPDGHVLQQGTNGNPDLRNRNHFWGDIQIPHNQNFKVSTNWTSALTLANGNSAIRCYIDGYLYRRVL